MYLALLLVVSLLSSGPDRPVRITLELARNPAGWIGSIRIPIAPGEDVARATLVVDGVSVTLTTKLPRASAWQGLMSGVPLTIRRVAPAK